MASGFMNRCSAPHILLTNWTKSFALTTEWEQWKTWAILPTMMSMCLETRNQPESRLSILQHNLARNSHMWLGNLVTMQWWDDIWLNESFANMISYICMDEAKGLEDITLAWNIFLDENFWGLSED